MDFRHDNSAIIQTDNVLLLASDLKNFDRESFVPITNQFIREFESIKWFSYETDFSYDKDARGHKKRKNFHRKSFMYHTFSLYFIKNMGFARTAQ